MLDGTPDMIVATDRTGAVVNEFNRGAEVLSGWSVEEAVGSGVNEIFGAAPESFELPQLDDGAEPWDINLQRRDGEQRSKSAWSTRRCREPMGRASAGCGSAAT